MAADSKRVLVFTTAYNEARTIGTLLDKLQKQMNEFEEESSHIADILVIDDCSNDNTYDVVQKYDVQTVRHPRNLGPGAATRTGYKYAVRNGYDITVRMDADGQHRPDDVPKLLDPVLADDADIVIGSRFLSPSGYDPSALRYSGIMFYSKLVSVITEVTITDVTSGFRAANIKVGREHAENMPNGIIAIDRGLREGLGGYRIVERPVRMRERKHGESYLDMMRLAKYPVYAMYSLLITLFRIRS